MPGFLDVLQNPDAAITLGTVLSGFNRPGGALPAVALAQEFDQRRRADQSDQQTAGFLTRLLEAGDGANLIGLSKEFPLARPEAIAPIVARAWARRDAAAETAAANAEYDRRTKDAREYAQGQERAKAEGLNAARGAIVAAAPRTVAIPQSSLGLPAEAAFDVPDTLGTVQTPGIPLSQMTAEGVGASPMYFTDALRLVGDQLKAEQGAVNTEVDNARAARALDQALARLNEQAASRPQPKTLAQIKAEAKAGAEGRAEGTPPKPEAGPKSDPAAAGARKAAQAQLDALKRKLGTGSLSPNEVEVYRSQIQALKAAGARW